MFAALHQLEETTLAGKIALGTQPDCIGKSFFFLLLKLFD
jgi:hypothetical protein